jgi:hypothetical protein
MKIGIVGLKPDQIAHLSGRRFNYELSFFKHGDKITLDTMESFARHLDRVIVMYPAVQKKMLARVPASKIHGMSGSVSTIIRYFDTLNIARKIDHVDQTATNLKPPMREKVSNVVTPVVEKPSTISSDSIVEHKAKTDIETSVMAEQKTQPPKLTQIIPRGCKSRYGGWQSDIPIIQPSADGSHSYDLLDSVGPGNVVRYARPVGIATTVWKQRLYNLGANRIRSNKQAIEAHFYNEYVDLFVIPNDSGPAAPDTSAAPKVVQTVPSEVLTKPCNAEKINSTASERQMWRAAYVACLQHSGDTEKAVTAADVALLTYRHRFAV